MRLQQRGVAGLPALFILELALARLWLAAGISPCAVMGHSAGEVAAACVAGLLSLPDALALACWRGLLLAQAGGGLLAVEAGEAQLQSALTEAGLDLAAVNAPGLCTLSGPVPALDAWAARLQAEGIGCRRLPMSVAAHSRAVEPLMPQLLALTEGLRVQPAQRPFLSAIDGRWVMPGERLDRGYWARHLRQPVRCDLAVVHLAQAYPQASWLECGPGQAMGALARANGSGSRLMLASAGRPSEGGEDLPVLLAAAGALWCQGAEMRWDALRVPCGRRRVSLPTTPFAREQHWIEAPREVTPEIPRDSSQGSSQRPLQSPSENPSKSRLQSLSQEAGAANSASAARVDSGAGATALPPRLTDTQDWFSHDRWELDALPPTYLHKLVEENVTPHIDPDAWQHTKDRIARIKARITDIADNFKDNE